MDLGSGASPYNYSDMTGFVSIGATSPQGFWRVLQDAGSPGAAWSSIAWNDEPAGSEPAGTEIRVEARAADAIADLAGAAFVDVVDGADPGLAGRYIEVRATLLTTDPAITPALSDVRILSNVDGNSAPALAAIGNRAIAEELELTFTASATDPDEDGLAFSLGANCPSTATISPTGGGFSWTPTETQGPGNYPCTISVTDDGAPALSDSETVSISVTEVNRAPTLDAIGDTTRTVGTALGITAHATDPDLPANALTYSLPTAPSGATINPSTGVISWTPTAAAIGPNAFTVRVTDNGTPALTDDEEFSVRVDAVNAEPSFGAIVDPTIPEQVLFTLALPATDPDAGDSLTFSLVTGPTGVAVSAAGSLTWTPTEAQGPGPYEVTIRVTDDGTPALSDDATFTITVSEVNRAPTLDAIGDTTRTVGTALGITAHASDPDLPANGLTYSLPTGPSGATINASTGVISWTPTAAAIGPNAFTVRVTDNGSPALFDEEVFSVRVDAVGTAPPGGHLWVGLRNSDDQGTQFDLLLEQLVNGTPVASGLQRCITSLTRNPNQARLVNVAWDPAGPVSLEPGDVVTIRISTRIGTNPNGTKCAGPGGSHNNARGLRLYYDAASRASHLDPGTAALPNATLYLHSDGGLCDKPAATTESRNVTTRYLDSTAPTATLPRCKDSSTVNFAGGNPFAVIGTWSLPPLAE